MAAEPLVCAKYPGAVSTNTPLNVNARITLTTSSEEKATLACDPLPADPAQRRQN